MSTGMWWLNRGCGGSMVVHQAVKPAVPGSHPASLQPAGTCHSLLGSQQGWHDNCRLASEGRQRQIIQKYPTNNKKKIQITFVQNFTFIHLQSPLPWHTFTVCKCRESNLGHALQHSYILPTSYSLTPGGRKKCQ